MIAQLSPLYIRTRPLKAWGRLVSYALFEGRPATTKGRWINPLVRGLFALEKRLPALKRVEKPIYIVGVGRSGTTVLGTVLSMHRDVAFLNEPKALWHSAYGNEDLIGSYAPSSGLYRLGEAEATDGVRMRFERLYGACLAATMSSRIVDKYPECLFRIPFIRALFPDARFLLLIRDGRAACASITQWSESNRVGQGASTEDWWGVNDRKWRLLTEQIVPSIEGGDDLKALLPTLSKPADRAAVEWIVTMREGLQVLEDHKDAVLPVRYEELTADPESTLKRIATFCGLREDPTCIEYGKTVLAPGPSPDPLDISPELRPSFDDTMRRLGYATDDA